MTVAQQWQQAETLYQIGLALNSTLNYEEVLDRILEQAGRVIAHDAASIALIEGETTRVFRWQGYAKFDGAASMLSPRLNQAQDIAWRTMQETGQPLVIPNVANDDIWVQVPELDWIKSYLGAPLRVKDDIIGFLNLNSATPGFFDQVEVDFLQAFTDQAGLALQNARLHDQTRREVTQRVLALKDERNFIAAVLDTVDALVVVLNRQGRIVRFNRTCEQVTGYTFAQVKGCYWWDVFLVSDEVQPVRSDFEKLWLHQPPRRFESHCLTRNGEHRLIVWSNTPLFDQEGQVEFILSTGIDLTERRRAEEQLRKLSRAVEQSANTVMITDTKGYIEYVNPKFVETTGYTAEEAIGQHTRLLKSGATSPEEYRELWQTIMTGGEWRGEFHNKTKHGDLYWEFASISPIKDEQGRVTHFLAVKEDITKRKQAEAALRATNEQLQALTDRLQAELTLAQKIQQGLLPLDRPTWTNLQVVCYNMAAREVGGDFYAYHAFDNRGSINRYAVAIGDVSGKGMPAALLMATSLTALQSVITHAVRPNTLLSELDLAIQPYTKTTRQNCALCYVEMLPPSSDQACWQLRAANAGCIAPMIVRRDGRVEWVDVGGLPLGLGIGAETGYVEATVLLDEGDLVIMTSDGLIEAFNAAGEFFGFERLEQTVASGPRESAAKMLAHIRAVVTAFTNNTEPHDDLTIVIVQV